MIKGLMKAFGPYGSFLMEDRQDLCFFYTFEYLYFLIYCV
ncbi:hypothetical protein SRABI96_03799 [Peribacillus sp. Bi96]|nr:hypothetical protein SRABI96_03799 [Peribacillus sp. Bi96]